MPKHQLATAGRSSRGLQATKQRFSIIPAATCSTFPKCRVGNGHSNQKGETLATSQAGTFPHPELDALAKGLAVKQPLDCASPGDWGATLLHLLRVAVSNCGLRRRKTLERMKPLHSGELPSRNQGTGQRPEEARVAGVLPPPLPDPVSHAVSLPPGEAGKGEDSLICRGKNEEARLTQEQWAPGLLGLRLSGGVGRT